MSTDPRPAPLPNNRIPRRLIFAFAAVFMLVLVALPFAITKGIAVTKERSHAMTLLHAAGLIVDTTRGEVREIKELSALAGRFALSPADAAKVREKLAPVATPPAELLVNLKRVCGGTRSWYPSSDSPGPWRIATGVKDGLLWHAVLDEGAGVLWIHGSRPKAFSEPAPTR